jgi:predicted MFS family arabinose efflux permease
MQGPEAQPHNEWKTGWPILVIAFTGVFWMSACAGPLAVLVKPISSEWGWSRGETSLIVTINALIILLLGPLAGAWVHKYGPIRMALVGSPLSAISLYLAGQSGPNLMLWYGAWTFFAIVQLGSNIIVGASAITSLFKKNRGAALAVALSGSAAAHAVMPILTLDLYKKYGIGGTFTGLGCLLILTSLPFLLIQFFRQRPEKPAPEAIAAAPVLKGVLTVMRAMRRPKFWQLTFGFMTIGGVVGSIAIHFQALMTDKGMSMEKAAWIMSLFGPAMLAGRFITGVLLDRCTARQIILPIYSFPVIACFVLANFEGAPGWAIVAVTFAGFAMGAEGDMLAYFIGRYFGTANFAPIYATMFGLFALAFGSFPVLAGFIYDLVGSYDSTYMVFGALLICGTLTMLLLGDYPAGDELAMA